MCSGRSWRLGLIAVVAGLASTAWAGGPRFITGTSGFTTAGVPMAWYTSTPMYSTDPGALSSSVSHAQADAMVAAAASVWNIPTASLTLAQGGELAEHVSADGSSPNTYFDGTEVVWPADVEASNYASVQIAVVYDTDGSVIDLLLGSGASDPSGCQQNGVVESVDQFGSSGTIEHAVIVLNGLCAGSDPNELTQMQYQLTRVFGKVLGLAWSQLNDGVFTGTTETAAAMALWPLMHPIDIDCGPYTYQCMQNPFTLRPDDINALEMLYPVVTAGGGKTLSSTNTVGASGWVIFPTGQGMEITNVIVYRWILGKEGGWEAYPSYASTTGADFQENSGNPISGPEPASENAGANTAAVEGTWSMPYIAAGPSGANLYFYSQTINPLYWGEYAVGPYQRPVTTMSGPLREDMVMNVLPGVPLSVLLDQVLGTKGYCEASDGTETNPPAASTTGWWNQSLCSVDFAGWRKTAVNANTSWTIEVTALNETGAGTVNKMQPVIGVWNLADATGTLPTVASQPAAMNSMVVGMTQMRVPAAASASTYRIAIADEYGGGRPDFVYTARILDVSRVSPATIGTAGGTITVTGMGFQAGNEVLVNGVAATATSWTSTQIVATVPSMAAVGATSGTAVDVEVLDPVTGGTSDAGGALTYSEGTKDVVALVSAPSALETGHVAATPFAVRVYQPDGATPAAGASVSFVVTGSGGGAAVATGCGFGPGCVVTTDATGLASTPLMGVAAGSVTVSGTEMSGGASVQVTMADANPAQTVAIGAAAQYLAAGAAGSWSLSLAATQDGAAAAGVPVSWTTSATGFSLAPATGVTAANGIEGVVASVAAIGSGANGELANVVTGCAWTSVCANWTVYGVAPSKWVIAVMSGGAQSVVVGTTPSAVKLQVTDGAGHALPGATVNVYQTAYAWEGTCGLRGACASAPVLMTAQSTAVSDGSGMVQVTPLEAPGVAQVVRIAASTGTMGFATTSVSVAP